MGTTRTTKAAGGAKSKSGNGNGNKKKMTGAATTEKRTETGIEIVEDFLGALEALDADRALALLADDVVYQNVPFPADRGKEAVTRTLRGFEKVVSRFEVKMHNIAERDGVVLTERTDILVGPALYLDIWVCGTFEVRDGKIAVWRDYFDLGQVGLKLLTSPIRRLMKG